MGGGASYGSLLSVGSLFVVGLVGLFALPSVFRAGALVLVVLGGAVLMNRYLQAPRPAPMPQPRPQAEEIELRTLDKVRDANLISRDEYEARNDAILQRDR